MKFQIENYGDLKEVGRVDGIAVQNLLARLQAGDKRINFLENRYEKDISCLVQYVI